MFEKILVPLDGSRFGTKALPYAIEIAKRFDSELVLMKVVFPTIPGHVMSLNVEATEIAKKAAHIQDRKHVNNAKRYLGRKLRNIKSEGIEASYSVIIGDPTRSIMSFIKKEHIDLVVMTTHGKSGFKRAVMGSVADAVIRESLKPVLVIRAKKK
jgi:nucleotide-binding universal stress UspA family protein